MGGALAFTPGRACRLDETSHNHPSMCRGVLSPLPPSLTIRNCDERSVRPSKFTQVEACCCCCCRHCPDLRGLRAIILSKTHGLRRSRISLTSQPLRVVASSGVHLDCRHERPAPALRLGNLVLLHCARRIIPACLYCDVANPSSSLVSLVCYRLALPSSLGIKNQGGSVCDAVRSRLSS